MAFDRFDHTLPSTLELPVGEFSLDEPGPDQRWSTWPAATPTERGPHPHPAWLVTSAAAFDTEWGIVKTGKEADVFLIERADPRRRRVRARREALPRLSALRLPPVRAATKRAGGCATPATRARSSASPPTDKLVAAGHWAFNEFVALCRAWDAGIPVPYPVQLSGTELLMEFIGDGRAAAPRLAQSRLHGAELADLFAQVVQILTGFARAGFAHGDLSAVQPAGASRAGRRDRPAADRRPRGEPGRARLPAPGRRERLHVVLASRARDRRRGRLRRARRSAVVRRDAVGQKTKSCPRMMTAMTKRMTMAPTMTIVRRRHLRDGESDEERQRDEHDRDDPPERDVAAGGRLREASAEELLRGGVGRVLDRGRRRHGDEHEDDQSDEGSPETGVAAVAEDAAVHFFGMLFRCHGHDSSGMPGQRRPWPSGTVARSGSSLASMTFANAGTLASCPAGATNSLLSSPVAAPF